MKKLLFDFIDFINGGKYFWVVLLLNGIFSATLVKILAQSCFLYAGLIFYSIINIVLLILLAVWIYKAIKRKITLKKVVLNALFFALAYASVLIIILPLNNVLMDMTPSEKSNYMHCEKDPLVKSMNKFNEKHEGNDSDN